MASLNIEGHGSFTLNAEQTQSLLEWLKQNGVAQTINTEGSSYDGNTLLNEDKGVPINTPKPKCNDDGSGTYDFGGTWM